MWRTVRWLDRCIEFHQKSGKNDVQNLFAIVQGGLETNLRDQCLDEMIARKDRVAGYAIGGLSGGEEKGNSIRSGVSNSMLTDVPLFRCLLEGVSGLRSMMPFPSH